ncbi:MAG: amidase [Deltaproteobacteria bacterium]|nr:amidase [Deltaproteobacteria bacterium]
MDGRRAGRRIGGQRVNLLDHGGAELATLLDRRETSSEELVRALHVRADEIAPVLNAFTREFREEALLEARRCDVERARDELRGPLHGLPLTLKDNIDVVGAPSTVGLRADLSRVVTEDAVVVAAARRAGAIVLGKSNVPQGMLSMECDNAIYGATKNPWSAAHVTGGSSSGEGALIASGASVMGLGTDLGGSIRFPAAFCGVVGFKPTQDVWSNQGVQTAIRGQELVRAQVGPMARRSDDIALLLRALPPSAQHAADWRVPPMALAPLPERRLRIGFVDDDGVLPANPAMRRAVREAADHLRAEGMELVPCEPWCTRELTALYLAAVSSDGLGTLRARFGDELPARSLQLMWRLGTLPRAARATAARLLGALGEERIARVVGETGERSVTGFWALAAQREELRVRFEASFRAAGIDALLSPASATPAVPRGMEHDASLSFSYLGIYNLLGLPAGVVPVTTVQPRDTELPPARDRVEKRLAAIAAASTGLPVAVQVAGPRFTDAAVVGLMQRIERAARSTGTYPHTPRWPMQPL